MGKINERQVALRKGGIPKTLDAFLDKRIVRKMPFGYYIGGTISSFTLSAGGGGSTYRVLTASEMFSSQTPPILSITDSSADTTVTGDLTTNAGGYVAVGRLSGNCGSADYQTAISMDKYKNILNLVELRYASNGDAVLTPAGETVYALLQCSHNSIDNLDSWGVSNVQVTFVYYNGDAFAQATVADGTYEIQINQVYQMRYDQLLAYEGGVRDLQIVGGKTDYFATFNVTTKCWDTTSSGTYPIVDLDLTSGSTPDYTLIPQSGVGGMGSPLAGHVIASGDAAAIVAWLLHYIQFNDKDFSVKLNGVELIKGIGSSDSENGEYSGNSGGTKPTDAEVFYYNYQSGDVRIRFYYNLDVHDTISVKASF